MYTNSSSDIASPPPPPHPTNTHTHTHTPENFIHGNKTKTIKMWSIIHSINMKNSLSSLEKTSLTTKSRLPWHTDAFRSVKGGGGKEEEKTPANITTMWLLLDLSSAANKDDKKVATNISSVVVKKHQIWPFLLLIISIVPCWWSPVISLPHVQAPHKHSCLAVLKFKTGFSHSEKMFAWI